MGQVGSPLGGWTGMCRAQDSGRLACPENSDQVLWTPLPPQPGDFDTVIQDHTPARFTLPAFVLISSAQSWPP